MISRNEFEPAALSEHEQTDPFEQGKEAAEKGIPIEANPFTVGSDEYALWSAGHKERASAIEAGEAEG